MGLASDSVKTPYSTMQSMADLAAVKTIELEGADLLSAKGFTQVPNHVLKDPSLSPGAKLTYAMLLSYAWHNDFCYPGQERLAVDLGAGKRSVVRYLQELGEARYIKIRKRGQGRTNIYVLSLKPRKVSVDK